MTLSAKGMMTTDGIDLNELLYGTILPYVQVYNDEEVLDLRALFTEDWDDRYRKFEAQPRMKFKRLGETERGLQHKTVWGKRQKDYERLGLEIGYTQSFLASRDASSEEVKKVVQRAIARDRALQTVTILNAMLLNSTDGFFNGSFTTEEKMTIPQSFGASSFAAAHTHYVATTSTTLALTDITSGKQHIQHHGYTGNIWGLCNSDFIKKIEDLAGWRGTTVYTTTLPGAIVDQVAIEGFKGNLLGVNWKVTEWMPDDYFMLIGQSSMEPRKPVAFIEPQNSQYKGLKLFDGIGQHPIVGSSFEHWLGAQVTLRGAGYVGYLGTSWTDPSIESNVIE